MRKEGEQSKGKEGRTEGGMDSTLISPTLDTFLPSQDEKYTITDGIK